MKKHHLINSLEITKMHIYLAILLCLCDFMTVFLCRTGIVFCVILLKLNLSVIELLH